MTAINEVTSSPPTFVAPLDQPNPNGKSALPKMSVVCLTESASRLGGGLFDAERRLQQTVTNQNSNLETTVIGMQDQYSSEDQSKWKPVTAKVVKTASFGAGLGYSPEFLRQLTSIEPDLVYCIGIWKYFSRACSQWHRATNRPYLIAPHGMLDPWAMHNHRHRKRVLWSLYQARHLKNATCIRALNESEAHSIRTLGLKNPICIIPNGVDLPKSDPIRSVTANDDGVRTLLFLGRIHPKKGLEVLLNAWKRVQPDHPNWRLRIAGWGQDQHVNQLNSQIQELNLSQSVHFVGPVFGAEKSSVFKNADAFILPSFSEGMPMTVLEAWSFCLPVIMTPFCNIPAGEAYGASLSCDPKVDSVVKALQALFEMNSKEQTEMGLRGRALVEQQFTWEKVATELADVYRWIVDGKSPPSSICFD